MNVTFQDACSDTVHLPEDLNGATLVFSSSNRRVAINVGGQYVHITSAILDENLVDIGGSASFGKLWQRLRRVFKNGLDLELRLVNIQNASPRLAKSLRKVHTDRLVSIKNRHLAEEAFRTGCRFKFSLRDRTAIEVVVK